jgi:urocanate hydratase
MNINLPFKVILPNFLPIFKKFVSEKIIPDIVTDQTSAHDELNGYIPINLSMEEAL